MVYQFLGQEEAQNKMQYVANTYKAFSVPPADSAQETRPSSIDYVKPPAERAAAAPTPRHPGATRRLHPSRMPIRHERRIEPNNLPVPPGFFKSVTAHFNVYSEGTPADIAFLKII